MATLAGLSLKANSEMTIANVLEISDIYVGVDVDNKRQLLQFLADEISKKSQINDRLIFDSILERESLGSTALGHHVALPHCRLEKADKSYVVFAKLNEPIEYDDHSVDIVFMLTSPEDDGAEHLSILSSISTLLRNEDFRKKVRLSDSPKEIYNLIVG